MPQRTKHPAEARILVFASAALAEGFGTIGVEVRRDPSPEELATTLTALDRRHDRAFVLIESGLAERVREPLDRIRKESAYLVIAEIPSLSRPQDYRPAVDAMVTALLGAHALSDTAR